MDDSLDAAIAEQRDYLRKLKEQDEIDLAELLRTQKHRREMAEVELKALERAASLRPAKRISVTRKSDSPAVGGHKGKQPGAISLRWRSILRIMSSHFPIGASEAQIVEIAQHEGLPNIRPRDARRQMEHFQKFNYVELVNDLWWVTALAIERFLRTPSGETPQIKERAEFGDVGIETADDFESSAVREFSSAHRESVDAQRDAQNPTEGGGSWPVTSRW
jgi:hypothetical protein